MGQVGDRGDDEGTLVRAPTDSSICAFLEWRSDRMAERRRLPFWWYIRCYVDSWVVGQLRRNSTIIGWWAGFVERRMLELFTSAGFGYHKFRGRAPSPLA